MNKPPSFTPHEKKPLGLKCLLIKSRSFRSRIPLGQTLHNRPYGLQLMKAIVACRLCGADEVLIEVQFGLCDLKKGVVTPAQIVNICFLALRHQINIIQSV